MSETIYPQIDSDAHVIETDHTWDFLEPEEEKYRPKLYSTPDNPGQSVWVAGGAIRKIVGFRFQTLTEKEVIERQEATGRRFATNQDSKDMSDVKLRLDAMDELGIDVQVLHNTLWINPVADDPAGEIALTRSWNRWMAEVHAAGDNRLFWSCVVPAAVDLEASIELMRYSRDNGAVAVCLRAYEGDLNITDPYFYPIFEEAERLNMAVAMHIGNGNPSLLGTLRTRAPHGGGFAPFLLPTVSATYSLMTSPITADFPNLRWGVVEAAASWIPWLCHQMWVMTGERATPEKNPFTDHNIWVTCEVGEDIPYLTAKIGEDVLMIGTDYGHTDRSAELESLSKLRNAPDITEQQKRKILSDNPAKLYAINERVPASA
jgi:uncharacterized protein